MQGYFFQIDSYRSYVFRCSSIRLKIWAIVCWALSDLRPEFLTPTSTWSLRRVTRQSGVRIVPRPKWRQFNSSSEIWAGTTSRPWRFLYRVSLGFRLTNRDFCHFWPLLKQVFEAAGAVVKIGSSLKPNPSLTKSLSHSVALSIDLKCC